MTAQMSLEQYVYSQVSPYLAEGEQIFDYGVFLKTNNKVRKKKIIKTYLAGITQHRIFLLETGRNLFSIHSAPKLENRGMVTHNLADMRSVFFNGIFRIAMQPWHPLRIVFNDGTLVEYMVPISPKICASQPVLSSYPGRLEFARSTGQPLPNGQLPAVPPQALQLWSANAAAGFKKERFKNYGIMGAGLFGIILAISSKIFLFALVGIIAMFFGFVFQTFSYGQRVAAKRAGVI